MSEGFDSTTIAAVEEIRVESWNGLLDSTAVNAYLAAGWVLLGTYTEKMEGYSDRQVYCLGWPRTLGEVTKPTYKTRSQLQHERMLERGERMRADD
jgi:hypothetical protein